MNCRSTELRTNVSGTEGRHKLAKATRRQSTLRPAVADEDGGAPRLSGRVTRVLAELLGASIAKTGHRKRASA